MTIIREKSQMLLQLKGLSPEEVQESRRIYGNNILSPPKREPWWKLLLEKFEDPVIRILMVAAAIAILVGSLEGDYIEGLGIIAAIILSTAVGFLNEYKAKQEFDILNQVNDEVTYHVIRDRSVRAVAKKDIVVGDIVVLETGEEVPADGCILEAISLLVNEASLTGEGIPVRKHGQSEAKEDSQRVYPVDKLLRGTIVADGHGTMQVTAVGDRTEIGETAIAAIEDTEEETPLNAQLDQLSKAIGVLGLSVAVLTDFALVLRGVLVGHLTLTAGQWYFTALIAISAAIALIRIWLPIVYDAIELAKGNLERPNWLENDRAIEWLKTLALALLILGIGIGVGALFQWLPASIQQWMPAAAAHQLLTYFTIAVTIIVVAVPEGLALSVTLSLAYSMRKMTQQNNLVRRMNACETIGAATVICSDKTGTLTLNEMRVRETNFPSLRDENISPLIAEAIAANTTANLERNPGEKASPLGNPTEAALLLWLDKHHIDYAEKRGEFRIVERWAFSTDRKYMATLGKSPENGLILHVKGAPEILLDRCSQILTPEGIRPLSHVETITAELKDYQMRGMRTLGFATVSSPENYREEMDIDELAQEMTWVGCVAIADPIRPEVPKALATCKKASIRIKMVTGDNPNTAKEIARQIGLISDSEPSTSYLTGPQFSQLKAEEAKAAAQNVKVLARARPADKQRLVKLLQDSGEVVAVTGDGTNDAPALNQAQVGLALGKNSTFVAKEASDIIILDRAFESIETAVMWGRSLYQNIQKFILFQLTINVAACGIALLGPFIGINLPLTVTQLLWVNLIMDTFAALALATEPPSETVMEVPPRDPQDFIITKPMAIAIFTVAPIFLVFLLGFLLYIQEDGTVTKYELSLFFTTFVMLQFWNLFNAKCFGLNKSAFSNLFENKGFITIATVILLGQILMVQFGGSLFRTVPLSVQDWLMIIGGTSSVLWLGEAARFFARMKVRSSH